jgi:hypothetical protein
MTEDDLSRLDELGEAWVEAVGDSGDAEHEAASAYIEALEEFRREATDGMIKLSIAAGDLRAALLRAHKRLDAAHEHDAATWQDRKTLLGENEI